MKAVKFRDKRGYLRRVLIRDTDGEDAARFGLPAGPPDIDLIDWDAVKRQINDYLVEAGIDNFHALQREKGLDAVASIVKRHVQALYREKLVSGGNNG